MLYIAVYFYAIHSTDADIATVLCNVSQCESVILYQDVTVVCYVLYLLVVVYYYKCHDHPDSSMASSNRIFTCLWTCLGQDVESVLHLHQSHTTEEIGMYTY